MLAPQFEGIDSLVLSLLYGSALASVHDGWKNHSFDYTDLCWQSDVSPFGLAELFFQGASVFLKNPPANTGDMIDMGYDLKVGKISWRRAWQPPEHPFLEKPMDRGAWGLQSMG